MDRVLLFGAGASFGAGGIVPHAPPLGGHLYPALVQAYPNAWGALPADAAKVFVDQGFEAGMGFLWQHYSQFVSVLQKCLGHYFAQFQVQSGQVCAYRTLLSGLELRSSKHKVMLATLNYDLTLDICLQLEQVRFALGGTGEAVVLNKPHGACNIFNDSIRATAGISFTAGVSFGGGDIKAVPQLEALQRNADPNSMIPPVLAIFMEGKPCQTSPELLGRWQHEFETAVLSADRVGIIGVHPHSVDTHVWRPLAQAPGDLVYCGNEAAFDAWTKAHRASGATKFVGDRFGESVDNLVAALKD
jgi:hypothetical protein